jgi:hypothetical protein
MDQSFFALSWICRHLSAMDVHIPWSHRPLRSGPSHQCGIYFGGLFLLSRCESHSGRINNATMLILLSEAHLNQDTVQYSVYSMAAPGGNLLKATSDEKEAKEFAEEWHRLKKETVEVYETRTTVKEVLKLEI